MELLGVDHSPGDFMTQNIWKLKEEGPWTIGSGGGRDVLHSSVLSKSEDQNWLHPHPRPQHSPLFSVFPSTVASGMLN